MISLTQKRLTGVILCGTAVLFGFGFYQHVSTNGATKKETELAGDATSQEAIVADSKQRAPRPGRVGVSKPITTTVLHESSHTEEHEDSFKKHDYIIEHFRTVGDVRPGSEERYQASLQELRENPETVADLLDLFAHTDKRQWNRQWLIVETLGELNPVKGIEVFVVVLNRPSLVTKVAHGIPNLERMIQFSAVDQLRRASLQGSATAQRALDDLREHPEPEVIAYLAKI